MTVKQADDINNLFMSYNDSIKVLNERIWKLGYDVKFAGKQIEALDGTLSEVKTSNDIKDKEIAHYKQEMKRIEKLEWIDKKTKVRVGIGLGGVLLTWTLMFIFSK